jgi:DNA polymerase delta subunit 1
VFGERLSSSALGDNDLSYLSMPGRLLFDTMNLVKRDHKLDSYAQLGRQALHRRRQGRHHAGDIFRLHAGDDDDRAVVAKYCKDCALCNCSAKLCAVTGAFGMAEVCKVPTTWIFLRPGRQGAESRVVACRQDGYAIPVLGGVQGRERGR